MPLDTVGWMLGRRPGRQSFIPTTELENERLYQGSIDRHRLSRLRSRVRVAIKA